MYTPSQGKECSSEARAHLDGGNLECAVKRTELIYALLVAARDERLWRLSGRAIDIVMSFESVQSLVSGHIVQNQSVCGETYNKSQRSLLPHEKDLFKVMLAQTFNLMSNRTDDACEMYAILPSREAIWPTAHGRSHPAPGSCDVKPKYLGSIGLCQSSLD